MKALILKTILITLLITTSSYASYGGIVKSKENTLYAECVQYEDKECIEFEIISNHQEYGERVIEVLKKDEIHIDKFNKKGNRIAGSTLRSDYVFYGSYGTQVGTYLLLNVPPVGFLGLAGGFAIDVIKSPVMLASYGVHKITDKIARKRFKKLLNHMFNPNEQGKVKKTRKRYFNALRSVFVYLR